MLQYEMGNSVRYTNVAPNATKRLILKRNGHSCGWQMLINGELYKYLVVDSLDLYKSGFAVDTINPHWLDDVEYRTNKSILIEKEMKNMVKQLLIVLCIISLFLYAI
ncbi:MAG: hypothetical protein ACLU18_14830 [Bacteroides thetaiotaomicron]